MSYNCDFFLWKFSQKDSAFHFFHQSELPEMGFSSVYGVSESDANAIKDSGSYAGFRGVAWSDKLWVDCDTTEAVIAVEQVLRDYGLAYEKWNTGRRGAHFGIERKATPNHLLPLLDKQWAEEHLPTGTFDNIYGHLHLFRRPGAKHEETGRSKVLEFKTTGASLDFTNATLAEAPRNVLRVNFDRSVFEDQAVMSMSVPHHNGGRHRNILNLAIRLSTIGQPYEFAVHWCHNVNLLSEPLPDEEVEEAVFWAYNKRAAG